MYTEPYTADKILGACLGVMSAAMNLLALIVLSRCKEMVFQIRIFAMNLAISDFLQGAFWIVSLLILRPFIGTMTHFHYRIYFHILTCIGIASVCSVCCFAFDRLMTCVSPMAYPNWMSKKKAYCFNLFVWVFANLMAFIFYYRMENATIYGCESWLYDQFSLTFDFVSYIAFFLFMATAYGVNMKYAKSGANKVIPRHLNSRGNMTTFVNFFKSSLITLCVSSIVIICHFGIFCIITYSLNYPGTLPKIISERLHLVTCGLCLSASLLNPLLYVWRFRECQIVFLSMFCPCNGMRAIVEEMTDEFHSRRIPTISPRHIVDKNKPDMFDFSFGAFEKSENTGGSHSAVTTPDITDKNVVFNYQCSDDVERPT